MAFWLDTEEKCANPVLTVTIHRRKLPITQHNWLRYRDQVVRHFKRPRSIANTQVITITKRNSGKRIILKNQPLVIRFELAFRRPFTGDRGIEV